MLEAFFQIILVVVSGVGITSVALIVTRFLADRIDKKRDRQKQQNSTNENIASSDSKNEAEDSKPD